MPSLNEIILVCKSPAKRMEYIARFITSRLGYEMKIIPAGQFNTGDFKPNSIIINYDHFPKTGFFNIFSNDLLFESGIRQHEPDTLRLDGKYFLYAAPIGFDLTFDIFSACFYLLSRYEEYLPFIPDRYGRFEAGQSLAFKNGFLGEPVIDQWIILLERSLQKKFPGLKFPVPAFRQICTFDIDNPWAYKHMGLLRETGRLMKPLLNARFRESSRRLAILTGTNRDPFDTYEYIQSMEVKYHFTLLFFFLLGGYDRYDPNYARNSRQFKKLLRDLGKDHRIGIHPSLRSNRQPHLFMNEFKRFEEILSHPPELSRQHFLIVHLPETYRRLIAKGIKEDYSLGYASSTGFRAGTCSPFNFYDLAAESETGLVIHPFAIMDVTLQQYMSLSPREALEHLKKIAERVKETGGTFTTLWHNESLSEQGIWKGWRDVFEGMFEIGTRDEGQGTSKKFIEL